jgi:hypothetical protein
MRQFGSLSMSLQQMREVQEYYRISLLANMIRLLSTLLLAIGFCGLAGCGPHTDRLELSGKVTLNGEPIDGGAMRFTSVSGKKMSSGAMINGGYYKVPAEKGLLPGIYRVEISAPDNAAPPVMVRSSPGGPGSPAAPERIPDEYNSDSKHTIEVAAGADNHFDFEIASKRAK